MCCCFILQLPGCHRAGLLLRVPVLRMSFVQPIRTASVEEQRAEAHRGRHLHRHRVLHRVFLAARRDQSGVDPHSVTPSTLPPGTAAWLGMHPHRQFCCNLPTPSWRCVCVVGAQLAFYLAFYFVVEVAPSLAVLWVMRKLPRREHADSDHLDRLPARLQANTSPLLNRSNNGDSDFTRVSALHQHDGYSRSPGWDRSPHDDFNHHFDSPASYYDESSRHLMVGAPDGRPASGSSAFNY